MSDRDDTQGIALAVAMVAAGLVVAGVIALAVLHRPDASDADTDADDAASMEAPQDLGPVERIDFEPGSAGLPPDAKDALERAADAARTEGGLLVLVLPFVLADADASAQALAETRGRAVRHALEANGVPPQRVILARPGPAPGPDAAKSADRVEVRLQ